MRITVLCTDLGIRIPGSKGASMHLTSITSAFAGEGHEVQLIAVAGHGAPAAELVGGLADVHLLPHPGRREGIRRELTRLAFVGHVVERCGDAVRAFAPDAIYERLSLFGSAGRRLIGSVRPARHVVEVNALLAEEDARWRGLRLTSLARSIESGVLASADVAVAVSDQVADKIRLAVPDATCRVVENGADVARFRELPSRDIARRRLGLPVDATIATFVGALRPWHGVDVAIRALPGAPLVHLAVVGDGPIEDELRRLAHYLDVADRVHFLGHRAPDEVVAGLTAADMALAPYPDLAGFSFSPLKLYEYLAAGTPVIASDIGQIPDALDRGRFGTLVPPGDAEALAAAMRRVPSDPGATDRARRGRDHALRHHGWDDRARRIAALMEASDALV